VVVAEGKKGPTLEVTRPLSFLPSGDPDPQSLLTLRAVASVLLHHPHWKIAVGVRSTMGAPPAPRTPPAAPPSPLPQISSASEVAEARARAVVAALRRYARRDQAAEVAPWATVLAAPRAAEQGVGFVVISGY
jgi:hypothetical protein